MAENKHLIDHHYHVIRSDREELHKHEGVILWFTGLSSAGKSTIANEVIYQLHKKKCRTFVLDGDNIRKGLNSDLGFTAVDRKENIRRIGEVAKLFLESGTIVAVCFISPYEVDRQLARSLVNRGDFIEIYVNCSIEICEKRDPKNLYALAREGKITNFTGISAPYEPPPSPEIEIRSDLLSIKQAAEIIVGYLQGKNLIPLERKKQRQNIGRRINEAVV